MNVNAASRVNGMDNFQKTPGGSWKAVLLLFNLINNAIYNIIENIIFLMTKWRILYLIKNNSFTLYFIWGFGGLDEFLKAFIFTFTLWVYYTEDLYQGE